MSPMLKYGPPIDVEGILDALIRGQAKARSVEKTVATGDAATGSVTTPAAKSGPSATNTINFFENPEYYFFAVNRNFDMRDFLTVDSNKFIEALFIGLLRRPPEHSAKEYWSEFNIRSRIERLAIIRAIRMSPEGKRRNIKIRGYKRYMMGARILRNPYLQGLRSFLVKKLKF